MMAPYVLIGFGLILLAAAAAVVFFARWLSRSWTLVAENEDDAQADGSGFWQRLRGLFGRGPPRLTYRRDAKGRFRKYRR